MTIADSPVLIMMCNSWGFPRMLIMIYDNCRFSSVDYDGWQLGIPQNVNNDLLQLQILQCWLWSMTVGDSPEC